MDTMYALSNSSDATASNMSDTAAIIHPLLNTDYFILSVMISVLSFVGIVGNIPVLIVYFRRKDKKGSNTFIKILAFLDLLVCSFIMPYSIIYEFHLVTSDIACRVFEIVRHFTITASNLTLIAIAVERYIAVCQIGTKINVKSLNHGIGGILAASLCMAAPSVGTFAVVSKVEVDDIPCIYPHEATTGHFCHFTYTVMGKEIVTAYQGILLLIFILGLLIIVILYTIIYVVLWNKTKIRRQLTKRRESSTVSEMSQSKSPEHTFSHKMSALNLEEDRNSNSVNAYSPMRLSHTITIVPNETFSDLCDTECSASKADTKVTFQPVSTDKLIQSDVIVSSVNKCVTVQPVPKKKNLNISFGAADKAYKPRKKRHYHRRTAKMLFLCTVIYFVTWLPFWFDIFRITNSIVLRYMFFIGNATNPIVYGIVNKQVRRSFKNLFLEFVRKWCKMSNYSENIDIDFNGSTSGGESATRN